MSQQQNDEPGSQEWALKRMVETRLARQQALPVGEQNPDVIAHYNRLLSDPDLFQATANAMAKIADQTDINRLIDGSSAEPDPDMQVVGHIGLRAHAWQEAGNAARNYMAYRIAVESLNEGAERDAYEAVMSELRKQPDERHADDLRKLIERNGAKKIREFDGHGTELPDPAQQLETFLASSKSGAPRNYDALIERYGPDLNDKARENVRAAVLSTEVYEIIVGHLDETKYAAFMLIRPELESLPLDELRTRWERESLGASSTQRQKPAAHDGHLTAQQARRNEEIFADIAANYTPEETALARAFIESGTGSIGELDFHAAHIVSQYAHTVGDQALIARATLPSEASQWPEMAIAGLEAAGAMQLAQRGGQKPKAADAPPAEGVQEVPPNVQAQAPGQASNTPSP